jgi:hypothetical protein
VSDPVQGDRAQQQRVARDREQIREVEGDAVQRARDDERVGHALRPREQRDEIPECTAARDARATRGCIRRDVWHEHDECRNHRGNDHCDERRARVMKLRRRE